MLYNFYTKNQPGTNTLFQIYHLAAVDNSTLYAVGDLGAVRKSVDGGLNWFAQAAPTENGLLSVAAVGTSASHTIFAVGREGTIQRHVVSPL